MSSLLNFTNFVSRDDPCENESTLICFTDGSCYNNGKHNASSGFAVHWPYHNDLDYSEKLSCDKHTNNRAEFIAALYAINQADTLLDIMRLKTLIIYTDSMLLIKSLSEWIFNWKKNNWKKTDGKVVLNQDLLIELDKKMQDRKILFRHVKAHTNKRDLESVHNDIVDKMTRF